MRVPLFVLAAAELASAFQPTGAFQLASPALSGAAVQGSRHAAVSPAVGSRVAGPLSALRSVARESGSEDAQMASARRTVLEKGAAGALALVLGANPLLAADEEEEVEEVAKPATVPREVLPPRRLMVSQFPRALYLRGSTSRFGGTPFPPCLPLSAVTTGC